MLFNESITEQIPHAICLRIQVLMHVTSKQVCLMMPLFHVKSMTISKLNIYLEDTK